MDNDGFRRLNAVYWQSYNNGYIDLNRIACYNSIKPKCELSFVQDRHGSGNGGDFIGFYNLS